MTEIKLLHLIFLIIVILISFIVGYEVGLRI